MEYLTMTNEVRGGAKGTILIVEPQKQMNILHIYTSNSFIGYKPGRQIAVHMFV